MTLDHVGPGEVAGFEHEGFLYRGDDEFQAGVLGFVRDGLGRGDAVVVVEPATRLELLRGSLEETASAADVAAVTWLDMAAVGANPARILGVWAGALEEARASGRTLRGVGEPAFAGRRDAELAECEVHERLLNVAFAGGEAWRLLCPYDTARLPAEVCRRALTTHPIATTAAGRDPSPGWNGDHSDVLGGPLPAPRAAVLRGVFGARDLPAVRRTVAAWARSLRLPEEQVEALELAASELASNSVRHGGGTGAVALWVEDAAAVVEFTDAGSMADPLVGRRRPAPGQEGGSGLYLVNHLCDLVQLRTSATGTTVRVTTWLG
jgi:anti-sigma regulatory factor (Ser/Thr protein kinase)